jgi:uncharacterized protein YabE (DUF348 family)
MNIPNIFRKPLVQIITAICLIVMGMLLIVLSIHKTVYLSINGEITEHQTNSITVAGFLTEQGIELVEEDRLKPRANSLLLDNETVYYIPAAQIRIQADGEKLSIQTAERDPTNILLEAGYLLFPKDRIRVNGVVKSKGSRLSTSTSHEVEILRGTPVELETEDGSMNFITDADTIQEAVLKQGISLFAADLLIPPGDTPLVGDPISVELIRSQPIQVKIGEDIITIRTTAETVGPALAQGGLALQGRDYSIPAEDKQLPDEDPIEIIRVTEEIIMEQEQLQFTSEYQALNDLDLDQIQIVSGGEYGLQAKRSRVLFENGEEISRKVEKLWVVKEPKSRVIGYGTRINLQSTNTDHGKITYWRKITAYATSYDSTCPGCDTITASGSVLKKGSIAVTLDWYRYMKGAKVYIPGYGFGTIEDVGGGVPWSTNWVDLGYKKDEYVPWSENVTVYFLAPAPPPENIMYVLY